MNSKTFNKILSFYHEGVSEETCICIILDKMEGCHKTDMANTIHRFYTTIKAGSGKRVAKIGQLPLA